MARKKIITEIDATIKLNVEQIRIRDAIMDPKVRYALAIAGAGLGKTFGIMNLIFDRAIVAPGSHHMCLRSTLTDVKSKLFETLAREVLDLKLGEGTWERWRANADRGCLPSVTLSPPRINFPNNSVIAFGGFDPNNPDRSLGPSYSTIFINEVAEWDNFEHIIFLDSRLRERVTTSFGKLLNLKFIMDCNPPSDRHWTRDYFRELRDPDTGFAHTNPEQFTYIQGNAEANRENLAPGYLEALQERTRGRPILYMRLVKGDWYQEIDNPLFYAADIKEARHPPRTPDQTDDLTEIIVSVDPATSDGPKADETGIIVTGQDAQNHAYVLADLSGKYQPKEWAAVAVEAYHTWRADRIVAEKNQGGDMVASNLRTVDPTVPIHLIHASRSKGVRAEATSTVYSQRRVHHCGHFIELENQLLEMELNFDRKKRGSPDRLDALVHGINHLLVAEKEKRGGTTTIVKGLW